MPALIYPGVLAEYSWSPTTTQSGSFLCIEASSTSIQVVTREVRYIHELSLTLEHSIPISNPAALGLTDFEFSPGMQPNSLLPYIHIYLSIFRFVIN